MSKSYKCSLIISLYNQAKQLRLILHSAVRQTERDFEIVLADDGSSDEVLDIVREFEDRLAIKHIQREDEGHRKTLALNAAVKASDSHYLIVIDGDIILHHRFIEMHLKYAQSGKVMCGWRGCKIKEAAAKKMMQAGAPLSTSLISVFWGAIKGEIELPFRSLIVENAYLRKHFVKKKNYVGGCNFALFKDDYELCNGMDESIHQFGYEDVEITKRLKNNGIYPKSIANLANTYHLEHPKKEWDTARKIIRENIHRNKHKVCKYGLKVLTEGSTNSMFIKELPEE